LEKIKDDIRDKERGQKEEEAESSILVVQMVRSSVFLKM
jgi:hypothetical protein